MTRRSSLASLALLVPLVLVSVPSRSAGAAAPGAAATAATTPGAAAKARGDAAMIGLDYDVALAAYAEAYQASHDPALLYNQARASQALGDYAAALAFLDQFSAQAPASLKAKVPQLESLRADLVGHVATLSLTCNVNGAEVLVGNRVLGRTPLPPTLKINAGAATLVVRADGYLPETRAVNLPGGNAPAVAVAITLRRTDVTGVLLVRSPVAGTNVLIDGSARGTVPFDFATTPGRHDLRLSRDGYDEVKTSVVLAPAERKTVDVELVKSTGILGRWYFWTAVGVGVAAIGGVTGYILATHERGSDQGSIAPGKVSAPLVSF
jgi:hypothetical protein